MHCGDGARMEHVLCVCLRERDVGLAQHFSGETIRKTEHLLISWPACLMGGCLEDGRNATKIVLHSVSRGDGLECGTRSLEEDSPKVLEWFT